MDGHTIRHINLPLKGFSSETVYQPYCSFRMAEPIAKLYKKMLQMDRSVETAISVCKQAHYHLLMNTSQAMQVIPRHHQTIRAETRFKVGLPCIFRPHNEPAALSGLIENLSIHGLRFKLGDPRQLDRLMTGDPIQLCIQRVRQHYGDSLWGTYRIRSRYKDSVSCELVDNNSRYSETVIRLIRQFRWRNALDQKDIFLWFVALTECAIRAQLQLHPSAQLAFHTLETGAQVFCSTASLPVSEKTEQDLFLSLPITKDRSDAIYSLAQHSPHLHQIASRILHGRIRCITWIPNHAQ